jgi:hypothetical protein
MNIITRINSDDTNMTQESYIPKPSIILIHSLVEKTINNIAASKGRT